MRSREQIKREERAEWLRQHTEYLLSDEWHLKRKLVLHRDRYACQGCLFRPATQVHHLSYEHWKNEFLWELVSICDACHERVHFKANSDS